jgi:uncharacterized protein
MTTRERIDGDYTHEAKARNAPVVSILRMLRAALKYAEIEKMKPLTEEETIEVVSRELKKLKDSLESFRAGKREDLANQAIAEIGVLERYLPQQMSDDELDAAAKAKLATMGEVTAKDFGRIMSEIMKDVKGRAEGGRVSAAVKRVLGSA